MYSTRYARDRYDIWRGAGQCKVEEEARSGTKIDILMRKTKNGWGMQMGMDGNS
jgi:hypothetical protein